MFVGASREEKNNLPVLNIVYDRLRKTIQRESKSGSLVFFCMSDPNMGLLLKGFFVTNLSGFAPEVSDLCYLRRSTAARMIGKFFLEG